MQFVDALLQECFGGLSQLISGLVSEMTLTRLELFLYEAFSFERKGHVE